MLEYPTWRGSGVAIAFFTTSNVCIKGKTQLEPRLQHLNPVYDIAPQKQLKCSIAFYGLIGKIIIEIRKNVYEWQSTQREYIF